MDKRIWIEWMVVLAVGGLLGATAAMASVLV
jgi:hypothetical protein